MAALRASDPPLPTDEQVHELLRQRIDVEERGVGIAVGLSLVGADVTVRRNGPATARLPAMSRASTVSV